MNYGFGMIWPLASEYARRGWAVRRAGWDDEASPYGDTGRKLRWVVYQNSLYWLLYREASTGNKVTRVITATDFVFEDFYAEDWTVLSPGCYAVAGAGGTGNQQGKKPYPRRVDTTPVVDPRNPNGKFGACPVVPSFTSIRVPVTVTQTT